MNSGKETCELLKSIRLKLAQANGIEYQPHECTHEGPCPGTCPLCDQELELLQHEIDILHGGGKEVSYDVLTFDERSFMIDNVLVSDFDDEEPDILMGDVMPPLMGQIVSPLWDDAPDSDWLSDEERPID